MSKRSRGLLHFLWFEMVVISTLWVPRTVEAIPLAGMDIARSTFDEAIARVVQRSELSARPGSIYCFSRIARVEKGDGSNDAPWRRNRRRFRCCSRESCSRGTCGFLLNGRLAGLGSGNNKNNRLQPGHTQLAGHETGVPY